MQYFMLVLKQIKGNSNLKLDEILVATGFLNIMTQIKTKFSMHLMEYFCNIFTGFFIFGTINEQTYSYAC